MQIDPSTQSSSGSLIRGGAGQGKGRSTQLAAARDPTSTLGP